MDPQTIRDLLRDGEHGEGEGQGNGAASLASLSCWAMGLFRGSADQPEPPPPPQAQSGASSRLLLRSSSSFQMARRGQRKLSNVAGCSPFPNGICCFSTHLEPDSPGAQGDMKEVYVNPLARMDGDSLEQGLDSDCDECDVGDAIIDVQPGIEDAECVSACVIIDGSLSDPGSATSLSDRSWGKGISQRDSSSLPSDGYSSSEQSASKVCDDCLCTYSAWTTDYKDCGLATGLPCQGKKSIKVETDSSEADLMKERFAKLLLGEDMSGSGQGVCSALAISNAITNLSASLFGELWRLEPVSPQRKERWTREMEWLLSVADYVIELVPSKQTCPDGSTLEVLASKCRSDIQINLPALRKLDEMLLECLDTFPVTTEFWYSDRGGGNGDGGGDGEEGGPARFSIHREEKWWLPSPQVPQGGLSEATRKHLQQRRGCMNQVWKAALEINNQVLSGMEAPLAYSDALPKNYKAILGESVYRHVASDYFSPDAFLSSLDLSNDHQAVEVANRLEACIYALRQKGRPNKSSPSHTDPQDPLTYWSRRVGDFIADTSKKILIAERSESLLHCLKQKFPGLPQTLLDTMKIQYNKDVGWSILESYSRVLECLAFSIISRLDDILYVDDMTKAALETSSQT